MSTTLPPFSRLDNLREIIMPAAWVVWDMEIEGIRLDAERVLYHQARLGGELVRLEGEVLGDALVAKMIQGRRVNLAQELELLVAARVTEAAMRTGGGASLLTPQIAKARTAVRGAESFNLGSATQRAWLLYEALGLPVQRRERKKGEWTVSTDRRALESLLALKGTPDTLKPIIRNLIEIEHVRQLLETFVEPLVNQGAVAERVYPRYGFHRTATGRLASGSDKEEKAAKSDTNAQNQPDELRDMYIPDPGMCFVHADWKGVEWLDQLVLAGDREEMEWVVGGGDPHRKLAAAAYGLAYEEVSKQQRDSAKPVVYGYGISARKVAQQLGIPEREAKRILAAQVEAFPKVMRWREACLREAKGRHYLQTVYGWRRWFWWEDVPQVLAFLPSATAADMMKIRLPAAHRVARECGGRLVTTVHDSVLIQVLCEMRGVAEQLLREVMEAPFKRLGGARFPCTLKSGMNWLECSA